MTGLGWSAVTMASHVILVMSILFAFGNAIWVYLGHVDGRPVFSVEQLENPIIAVAITLVAERCYYITARLLVNTEVNLWEFHPVPEVLSILVALAFFWLAVSVLKSDPRIGRLTVGVISTESAAIALTGTVLVAGLW